MNDERDPRDTPPEPPRAPDPQEAQAAQEAQEAQEAQALAEPPQEMSSEVAPDAAADEFESQPAGSATQRPAGNWRDEPAPPPSEVEAYEAEPGQGRDEQATTAHSVPATGIGESTLCPRCGTENRPGLAFCQNCGQRLVAAGVAATVDRPGPPEGTQACPRCGTHNRAGTAFCQNCGANLRATGAASAADAGYLPPSVDAEPDREQVEQPRAHALLGPIVLIIAAIGLATAWLLPFPFGSGSLFERGFGPGGYGAAFWADYPNVSGGPAEQAYFAFAAAVPILVLLLLVLAIGGIVRARPGMWQSIGLLVALLWSIGLVAGFVMVELVGGLGGSLADLLRGLTPGGIIFFLASLIVLIGTLTRFGRS